MNPSDLPDVHFGSPGQRPNWREVEDEDPDDEELEETPEAVIMMLGFDPKRMDDDDDAPPTAPTGDAEFKEAEHKRDSSGKFSTTGGGGAPKKGKFMGSAPKGQSKITALPALAQKMHEASGKMPSAKEFHKAAEEAGFIMNESQAVKYMKMYKPGAAKPSITAETFGKYKENKAEAEASASKTTVEKLEEKGFKKVMGNTTAHTFVKGNESIEINKSDKKWVVYNNDTGEVVASGIGEQSFWEHMNKAPVAAPAPAPASVANDPDHKKTTAEIASAGGLSPTQMITNAATSLGYPKEGTFNNIEYFKAASGHKLSYKPDTDTWQATGPNKEVLAKGEGMLGAMAWLQHNKKEAAPASAGSPPFAHTQTATAAAQPSTSTATAKSYGHKAIPETKQKYTSKGGATEQALPPKVQEAIRAYKGNNHYDAINEYMRFGEQASHDTISNERLAYIANLEKGFQQIAPTTKDMTVGRKIGLTALKAWAKDAGVSDLNDLKAGDMLMDPGIISTSHNTSMGWSGNVRCIIKVPKGTKAIDISETINQSENELMLAPRTRFRVTSVEKGKGGDAYHVNMEVVNPKYD